MTQPPPAQPYCLLPGYIIVAMTGAAVMILELLGTRIIGPFYGVSLYVWSSLIAVTLIALASGYFLGGLFADRYPAVRLMHVILASALTTALIPMLSGSILRATDHLGLRAGAFTSALILFLLPLTALAMVGPYVIKHAARDLHTIGTVAGSVYGISTVGSVTGTLLLGFFLLPEFGTRTIIYSLSICLCGLALLAIWHDRSAVLSLQSMWALLVMTGLLLGGAASGLASGSQSIDGFSLRSEAESLYGWVRVVDDDRRRIRLLLSDASVLSAVDMDRDRSMLGYQEILGLLPTLRPHTTRALLIGLGGGHVARDLISQGVSTDTIEIDPAVADAARRWFQFKPNGRFLVGDARYEITRLGTTYDLVIHDCFTGGAEPTHLLTQEMLRELRGLLNEHGVLALNYVGFRTGEGSEALAAVHRTLASVFPYVRTFVTDKNAFTDFIFLATQEPLPIETFPQDTRVRWLLTHEQQFDSNSGFIITDDFNPMESRQVRKAETYRKYFLERIAFELLLR